MSNISTSLQEWGSVGSAWPSGYNHVENEAPVDAWENKFKYETISNIKNDLIPTVNSRLESGTGTAFPSTPETAELSYRTDEDNLYVNDTGGKWVEIPTRTVLASGTISHTGGTPTQFTVSGVTTNQTLPVDVKVYPNTDPSWTGDYAYNLETSRIWDDTNSQVDIECTVTWDIDPGSGNDLTLGYEVFEN